ncbi:MAG: cell division protein FtsQ/DivIB [Candidatus Omnitrophota bacterium]
MGRKRRKRFRQFNFRLDSKAIWWMSIVVCGLILLIGLGYAIYTSGVFKIKAEGIKDPQQLLSKSLKERITDKSLFSLDIKSIYSSLIRAHPEYKEIQVYRVFPSSLTIEATKRNPFAQIKDKNFYPVDKEAVILSEGNRKPLDDLILIEMDSSGRDFRKGASIKSKKLEYAFGLIEALAAEGLLDQGEIKLINVSRIEAIDFIFIQKNRAAEEQAPDGGIRVIVGKDDFRRKLKLFKNLRAEELKEKMSSVNYIDLRFKKVYMEFKR